VVIIPEITLKMLSRWLDRAPECPDYPGLVFSYRGKPVANYYIFIWAIADKLTGPYKPHTNHAN
jgi:hypothetical protein